MNRDIVVPGLAGVISLMGIIILTILGKTVPETLTVLAVAFGSWAFGVSAYQARRNGGQSS